MCEFVFPGDVVHRLGIEGSGRSSDCGVVRFRNVRSGLVRLWYVRGSSELSELSRGDR